MKFPSLQSQKIAVLGAGRSGKFAALLATRLGADVCVFDSNPKVPNQWPEDLPLVSGATEKDAASYVADLVILSPGIEPDSSFAQAFSSVAKDTMGDLEWSCQFYDGEIIAITGTNGKTTTTALIEHIMQKAGKSVVACGNYGVPVSEVLMRDEIPEVLALEASSFQLATVRNFHPHVAIWLNFAPDHMDRYKRLEDYYNDKAHIFDNLGANDLAVVRAGETLPHIASPIKSFTTEGLEADLVAEQSVIRENGTVIADLSESAMAQKHNVENAMAAFLACRHAGVPCDLIVKAILEFAPPGHRCELVRKRHGVTWLNDSKATNLHALEAALKAQDAPVILIAGGKDKGLDYSSFVPLLKQKAKAAIVFGQITEQLYNDFSPAVQTSRATDLADCVKQADALAQEGDVVLFSPGTSSFDMFSGYVQRGQVYRDAVNALN